MSITISLLTIETMNSEVNIMLNGWDYPTNILTTFANELDKQTDGWDWESVIQGTKFDSWAQMVENLGNQLSIQIFHQTCPSAEYGISSFLQFHFPRKFLKKYHYTIPTTSNLYGGFDCGNIEAINEHSARAIAETEIHNGFKKINSLLVENNLPIFEYCLDELTITLEK